MQPQVQQNLQLQQQLTSLASGLDAAQLQWASGFLAGLASQYTAVAAPSAETRAELTIWYGSETGNGRGVAERLAQAAEARGYRVELASLAEVQPRRIARVSLLLLVVSTHGEGDPPADALAFHKLLTSDRAPRLDALKFAVFALGDSSYPDFCQTGRELDEALAGLGAARILERQDVDVDFEPAEDAWRERALEELKPLLAGDHPQPHLQVVRPAAVARHDRRNPYQAEVLEVAPLTIAPSNKIVRHVALDIDGSGLEYQPGDALGLWPQHDRRLVEEILEVTGLDGNIEVERQGERLALAHWLTHRLELTQVVRPFVQAVADRTESVHLKALLDDRQALQDWVETRQVIDVLREFQPTVDAVGLVGLLRGIAPRLYSIASSPLASEGEVHLTVKREGGLKDAGQLRAGVASWQLTGLVEPGQRLPIYIEANPRFRLPDDSDRPVIMIGPGTGVAPFRAFVEHRQALGHGGRNWLFFGEQHRRTDFLYQLEWQRHLKSGTLHRLAVAFSRDQAEKLYVQHRIIEQGRAVYEWLEDGAHIYVCGSGQGMAADVHQALLTVIAEHGGRGREHAEGYLEQLLADKRYQKDVY